MRPPILFDPNGAAIILAPDQLLAVAVLVLAIVFCLWGLFRA